MTATGGRGTTVAGILLTLSIADAGPARAQGLAGRLAVEAIASASSDARTVDDPNVILDLVGTIRLAEGLDLVVRPWAMRRPGADWMFEMYQLQLRYVSSTRIPFRVDAGIIPSPVGLFTLELQPHRNPMVTAPFYYFSPLPPVDASQERLRLISGGYPLGAMFSVSGARWDARAGVTDSSPARPHNVLGASRPPSRPQLVVGGGVIPITGMRLGAGFTRGAYRPPSTSNVESSAPTATVFTVEGEYALGHTRISAEWVRDRFETGAGDAIARGFTVQAVRTLSPRTFAAARATHVSSPVVTVVAETRRTSTAFETSLGYRLSPEVTLRGGYQRERRHSDPAWRNAALVSIVWAARYW
jgi:hypothetical protein